MPGANKVLGCPQVKNLFSINSSAKISDNLLPLLLNIYPHFFSENCLVGGPPGWMPGAVAPCTPLCMPPRMIFTNFIIISNHCIELSLISIQFSGHLLMCQQPNH